MTRAPTLILTASLLATVIAVASLRPGRAQEPPATSDVPPGADRDPADDAGGTEAGGDEGVAYTLDSAIASLDGLWLADVYAPGTTRRRAVGFRAGVGTVLDEDGQQRRGLSFSWHEVNGSILLGLLSASSRQQPVPPAPPAPQDEDLRRTPIEVYLGGEFLLVREHSASVATTYRRAPADLEMHGIWRQIPLEGSATADDEPEAETELWVWNGYVAFRRPAATGLADQDAPGGEVVTVVVPTVVDYVTGDLVYVVLGDPADAASRSAAVVEVVGTHMWWTLGDHVVRYERLSFRDPPKFEEALGEVFVDDRGTREATPPPFSPPWADE